MGTETELKFRMPARDLRTLASGQIPIGRIGQLSESDLVSTYFDTGKHKLKRHGLSLRVRQADGRHIQTIKSGSAAQFARGEWETEVKGAAPDLGKADGTPLEHLVSRKLGRKLKPVFESSVHRIIVPVRTRRSEIEVAIDRGRIVAGQRSSPVEELELELKSGRPLDLFRIAKALGRTSGAELYLQSKSERGYCLARGEEGPVVAEPIPLKKGMEAGEAFRTIARSTVRHFLGNADAVRRLDPEGVHQMRVGLRRLRATISLFANLLPRAPTKKIKQELKWLTEELAPAREIDVFVKEQLSQANGNFVPQRGSQAVEREFVDKRAEALERGRKAVDSARFRALLVDVLEWIEQLQGSRRREASVRIGKFAAAILRRRIKKVRRLGRDLEKLSARERHKFRIRIKKIRYGVQFFEALFTKTRQHKDIARLLRHLKRIQAALGSLNDFAAHRGMAADAALKAPSQNRRARAFAAGVVLGRDDASVRPLLKAAIKEVRDLRRVDAF
jgi:inorganic triphosphatase YgiF